MAATFILLPGYPGFAQAAVYTNVIAVITAELHSRAMLQGVVASPAISVVHTVRLVITVHTFLRLYTSLMEGSDHD